MKFLKISAVKQSRLPLGEPLSAVPNDGPLCLRLMCGQDNQDERLCLIGSATSVQRDHQREGDRIGRHIPDVQPSGPARADLRCGVLFCSLV